MQYFIFLYFDQNTMVPFADFLLNRNYTTPPRAGRGRSTPGTPKAQPGNHVLIPNADLADFQRCVGDQFILNAIDKYLIKCANPQHLFNDVTFSDRTKVFVVTHGIFYEKSDTPTGNVMINAPSVQGVGHTINGTQLAGILTNNFNLPNQSFKLMLFICRSGGGRGTFKRLAETYGSDLSMPDVKRALTETVPGKHVETVGSQVKSALKGGHTQVSVYGYMGAVKFADTGKQAGMTKTNTRAGPARDFLVEFNADGPILPGDWKRWL